MGSQVNATCKCGFDGTITIGGGRLNFSEIDYFPALCTYCNDLVQVNLRDRDMTCPICKKEGTIAYDDKKLRSWWGRGSSTVAQTFDRILTEGRYHCPKCIKKQLRFAWTGMVWD